MEIKVTFEDLALPDVYSKKAIDTEHGMAAQSFPFEVVNVPEAAKTLAWTFVDMDSIPVCGFAYIHWVVANVPVNQTSIPADFARREAVFTKGSNSLVSKFLNQDFGGLVHRYIGPKPPDKDHLYTLTVYALDDDLDLTEGFFMNELLHAMEGHVLAEAHIDLLGKY